MNLVLFFVLMFGLPHANVLPLKLNVSPQNIPLGLVNLIMFAAVLLWVRGKTSGTSYSNPISSYTAFLCMVLISLGFALINSFEETTVTMTLAKMEISLLLLYYVPLAFLKDEEQFRKAFLLLLLIHMIIGVEVMKSGVLAGANFHDGKRGSGPFSEGLAGSDIAASYLAEALMFFLGYLFYKTVTLRTRVIAGVCGLILVFGIFATYSRGALVASVAGVVTMLPFLGLKPKYVLAAISLVCLGFLLAPDSVVTRVETTTTASGKLDDSTQGRFVYWQTAMDIIEQNPLGVGIGQVRAAFQYRIGKHVDPHNAFLYTACEYGVVGLIVFCVMLVRFYLKALEIWRDPGSHEIYRIYALGMGGMIGSFIACNLFYANFYKDLVMGTNVMHFGMLAFIAARIKAQKGENSL